MHTSQAFVLISLVAWIGTATAQADILVTRNITHTGQVVRVTSGGVQIKVGQNEFTIPLTDILRVDIAQPDAVEKGLTALRAGKNQEALTSFKSVVDRYGGLPVTWAEESMLRLGDVQLALKDFTAAKKTFDAFKVLYPRSPHIAVLDAKYARVLFEQNQPDRALQLIQGVLDPLLKRDYLTDEQEAGVAEGLILVGDCLAASGKLDDALDSYLKVVTLFTADPDRTAEAKYKAAKLFEQRGNWRRAKQSYDELLKENPAAAYVEDVKKRLADLTKAHPE